MRKFQLHTSNGSYQTVRCNTKHEANKLARQYEKLVGGKIVAVTEVK